MDKPSTTQLTDVVNVLANLVRSSHLKNVLHAIDPEPRLNFWRVIYGNLLDVAVIEWCKLFGSDKIEFQPTHWKNLVPVSEQDNFRRDLLLSLQIDRDSWNSYWTEMKNYRDMCAAHDGVEKRAKVLTYPVLDIAVNSSYFYYDYVLRQLDARGIKGSPVDLRAYCNAFVEQAREIAQKAMAATADITEKVY